jgi:Mg2+ and Co2+ transporter CorA
MTDADFTAWLEDFNGRLEFVEDAISMSKRSIDWIDLDTASSAQNQTERLEELENAVAVLGRHLGRRDDLIAELAAKRIEIWSALKKAKSTLTHGEEADNGSA